MKNRAVASNRPVFLFQEKFNHRQQAIRLDVGKIQRQCIRVLRQSFAEMIHRSVAEQHLAAIVQELRVFHASRQTAP